MLQFLVILIIIALSLQVLPVALGIQRKLGLNLTVWYALLMLTGQVAMFFLGFVLGQRFMHLMESFEGIVLFVGFSLISIRMIIDSFRVRRGERTYELSSTMPVIMASVAQGINTFLAALLLTFLPFERHWLSMILTISVLVVIGIGTAMKPDKTGMAVASLLFFASGLLMLFSSVYLGLYH